VERFAVCASRLHHRGGGATCTGHCPWSPSEASGPLREPRRPLDSAAPNLPSATDPHAGQTGGEPLDRQETGQMTKTCTRCELVRPLEDFYTIRARPGSRVAM